MTELTQTEQPKNPELEPSKQEILYFGTYEFNRGINYPTFMFSGKPHSPVSFRHWSGQDYVNLFGKDWDGKWGIKHDVEPGGIEYRESYARYQFKECMDSAQRYFINLLKEKEKLLGSYPIHCRTSPFRNGLYSGKENIELLNLFKLCLETLKGDEFDICTFPSMINSHGAAEVDVGLLVFDLSKEEIIHRLKIEHNIKLADFWEPNVDETKEGRPDGFSDEEYEQFREDIGNPEWIVNLCYKKKALSDKIYEEIRRRMGYDTPEHQKELWDYALSYLDKPEYWRILDEPERAKLARLQTNPLSGAFGY